MASMFDAAKKVYEDLGVDVEAAFKRLDQIPVSLHCWQGDDVAGFENSDALDGGIAVTGNYPGRARNADELRADIEKVLSGIGVSEIAECNPFEFDKAVETVKEVSALDGVKAIIFRAPCVNLSAPKGGCKVSDKCIGCKRCINETGCPALVVDGKKVKIDDNLCVGCTLCAQVCPVKAIEFSVK